MDTDLTKRQLRSRTLAVPTCRVLNTSQMTTMDTTDIHSHAIEQVMSSPRFNFSENEGSHKGVRGHRARAAKGSKANK